MQDQTRGSILATRVASGQPGKLLPLSEGEKLRHEYLLALSRNPSIAAYTSNPARLLGIDTSYVPE
jgi:hypothetical protein